MLRIGEAEKEEVVREHSSAENQHVSHFQAQIKLKCTATYINKPNTLWRNTGRNQGKDFIPKNNVSSMVVATLCSGAVLLLMVLVHCKSGIMKEDHL
ncbi:hypothetical protein XENOCAPTIV_019981 [Xenoophorus captivus]|uniref:Uncharacterized protein n=1 Tax=Xenoophorus captivus TaxID=1517983 RepID=A0ABV0RCW4_9TELE